MSLLRFSAPARSLIVPIAVPGSGKTTLLGQVAAQLGEPGFRFGGDDVRLSMYGSIATQGSGRDVHYAVRAMVTVRLAAGMPVAVDSTSVGVFERAKLLELAQRHGATPIALLSQVPIGVAEQRNKGRDASRQVPDFVITKMFKTMSGLGEKELLEEGFAAVHCFDEMTDELVIDFIDYVH